jgi:hypothetical protein
MRLLSIWDKITIKIEALEVTVMHFFSFCPNTRVTMETIEDSDMQFINSIKI